MFKFNLFSVKKAKYIFKFNFVKTIQSEKKNIQSEKTIQCKKPFNPKKLFNAKKSIQCKKNHSIRKKLFNVIEK